MGVRRGRVTALGVWWCSAVEAEAQTPAQTKPTERRTAQPQALACQTQQAQSAAHKPPRTPLTHSPPDPRNDQQGAVPDVEVPMWAFGLPDWCAKTGLQPGAVCNMGAIVRGPKATGFGVEIVAIPAEDDE